MALLWVSVWGYTILHKVCFLGGSSDAAGNCNVGVFWRHPHTFHDKDMHQTQTVGSVGVFLLRVRGAVASPDIQVHL